MRYVGVSNSECPELVGLCVCCRKSVYDPSCWSLKVHCTFQSWLCCM